MRPQTNKINERLLRTCFYVKCKVSEKGRKEKRERKKETRRKKERNEKKDDKLERSNSALPLSFTGNSTDKSKRQ